MGLFGSKNDREIKKLEKIADIVESLDEKFSKMSEDELKGMTAKFKERLSRGETLDDILPEAYATVREASKRVLNMKHFYVQIVGGIALHQGRIAEMRTGEGKTLVATLPTYLNALLGRGMHVVTVNEYLATRDSQWMGKLYNYLGLSVAVNLSGLSPDEKKKAYEADILYGTNNEFGFDYLRDNLVRKKENRVQRELYFALIDEVDSILIDEARTPLIISAPGMKSSELYIKANRFAKSLREEDYIIEEKEKTVRLSESGVEKAERFFNIDNLADFENGEINNHIYQAIRACFIMKRDIDYMVKDGEVLIIDEFTGRIMQGRRYSEGLHQAIEAKEGLRVKNENRTVATITFQNFFRMYKKLSGMTGTARTEEEEFEGIYGLDVVTVPTNKPMIRRDENDVIYMTEKAKIEAIVQDIQETHEKGQPVLVGTVTVEKSEMFSDILKRRGIKHNVLNAKRHAEEADIVAQAGKLGTVTIATNMAGRGTDIMLGGNPAHMAEREMKRQGFDDEQIQNATSKAPTDDKEILALRDKYSDLYEKYKVGTDEEKEKVVEVGGLRIIGTERHESRRIDNQLRGRSGRQGDPGSSVFYLSFDDELIRRFGGDRMGGMISMVQSKDSDGKVSGKFFTSMIESAQKRREGANFSIRKHVLSYDDVMNTQRNIMYGERSKVLEGEDMHDQLCAMARDYVSDFVPSVLNYADENNEPDIEKMNEAINLEFFTVGEDTLTADIYANNSEKEIVELIQNKVQEKIESKKKEWEELGINFAEFEREAMLKAVDIHWMEHIDAMDSLRKGIGLQAYGGRDPVIAYKSEGTDMFNNMTDLIKRDTTRFVLKTQIRVERKPQTVENNYRTSGDGVKAPAKSSKEPGNNDPCPCGSGKKYKHCCKNK
ncbi:MAG: preprotein translocase subunit SecA [Clostridia bacterium]|nr:preprotein translocase subunit SecA [Clostridia bacterium]